MHSCLYTGRVDHRRFTPREHKFHYQIFTLYLDLDELPKLFERFWLWSVNKRNIASFRRKDHLGANDTDLKTAVYDLVEQHTGTRPNGPIRLLTNLSYFGMRFNPVSFYYCFDQQDDTLKYIVAEVNNTPWGEQFCYVMDAKNNQHLPQAQRYFAKKQFHVSPFMPMDIDYDWRFALPGEKLAVHMENYRVGEKVFDATLNMQRRPINSRELTRVLIRFPFQTVKVVGAIYFEALRLWLKRIPFIGHPGASSPQEEALKSEKTS